MPDTRLVMRLEPTPDAVPVLLDRLEAYAEAQALSPKAAHRLAVVCEELAANVAMHGSQGEGAATYVEVIVDRVGDGITLVVEDDGRPFDPLAQATPDTELAVEDRDIGGLGIHFVRNMVRDIAYRRLDTLNRLTAVLDAA